MELLEKEKKIIELLQEIPIKKGRDILVLAYSNIEFIQIKH